MNDVKTKPVNGAYRAVVLVKKGDKIRVTGVEDFSQWYVDPDHFRVESDGVYFNAVDGYYSFDMNLDYKFVTVRRVKEDGSAATYKDEGAITFMGWGVAHPVMTNQFGWENGAMVTLAEVEDGVYGSQVRLLKRLTARLSEVHGDMITSHSSSSVRQAGVQNMAQ